MFCRHCGTELNEGARFCDKCGSPVGQFSMYSSARSDQTANSTASVRADGIEQSNPADTPAGLRATEFIGAQGSPAAQPHAVKPPSAPPQRSGRRGIAIAIVLVIVAVACVAVAPFLLFGHPQSDPEDASDSSSTQSEPTRHTLIARISAKGFDSETGTPIPLQIAGNDSDGNEVDELQFVESDGSGIELPSGSYEISFPASPISGDGTLYTMPSKPVAIEIGQEGAANEELTIEMKPITTTEVTDAQIAKAKEYADQSAIGEERVQAAVDKATKARDDAVAAKKAEEQRKAEEERLAREAIPAGNYSYIAQGSWLRSAITINGDGTATIVNVQGNRPGKSETTYSLERTDEKAPNGNVVYTMTPIAGADSTTMSVYYDSAQNALIVNGTMTFAGV